MALRTDGLTPRALQASSRTWWDSMFTQLLLDAIPLDTRHIVELDCGLAAAAHTLLPSLPEARYLGTDFMPERLAEARRQLQGARIAPRVELRLAPPTDLPVDAGSCDVVLSIMSLQHVPDVPAVLAEARRVLGPEGRVVAVEPDNLGQRFYFDGVMEEIGQLFHALSLKARVARQPADISVGPRLPALLREAGFLNTRMVAHVVQSSRLETAKDFCNRLERIAETLAHESGLSAADETVEACKAAIKRCRFAGMPKRLGFSAHTVPVFRCIGRVLPEAEAPGA